MFQVASAIPDKEILRKSKPKSSIFIENLTSVLQKLEEPENRQFL